jgi:hypothetical protein
MENQLINLVENNIIKWLPWIGSDFEKSKVKILIIGESHYFNPNEPGSFEKHQNPNFTITVIEEMAIGRDYYKTKIHQNFHRAILGNDNFDASKFWNSLAYYNFIQKPMDTNKGRPSNDDFYESWESFHEIIDILQPTLCLFIGTTAANSFNNFNRNNNIAFEDVKHVKKIGQNYAKKALLLKTQTPIHFIKHTSQYFSWKKWNEYLKETIPHELKWIENQVDSK